MNVGGSATAGCLSCCGGRESGRGSTASIGSIGRKDLSCASAAAEATGVRVPILVEAKPTRALVARLCL
jgi:hypothetical protein